MEKFKKSNINSIRSQHYSEREENQGRSQGLVGPYLIFNIYCFISFIIANLEYNKYCCIYIKALVTVYVVYYLAQIEET